MNLIQNWRLPNIAVTAVAVILLLIGLLLPSSLFAAAFRPGAANVAPEVMSGIALFRVGWVLLGFMILGLAGLPVWQGEDPPQSVTEPRWGLVLLGMLVVAFLMRLYQLNAGLWIDEILTYMNYARLPMGELISTYADENQHFMFSILARISFLIFGESAWALRVPAVLFGVASIGALYLFGRYTGDEREGLLAAALLAFSYHHLWFSQNARGYTGLLFWAILSSWFFLRALDHSRPQTWVWYGISAALGMYTHMTMMFVIFAQLVIYFYTVWLRRREEWPQRWFGFFFGFSVGGFLTLFFYSLVLPQMFTAIAETQSVVAEWRNPLWTILELVNGVIVGFSGGVVALGVVVGLGAMVLFLFGLVSYWRSDYRVILLLFLPAIVGAGITVGLGHHLWPRFFFFTFGFGALVVVRGVLEFGRWAGQRLHLSPNRVAWVGPALCVIMIVLSGISSIFAYGPKQDYGAAKSFVEEQMRPGDAIVAVNLTAHIYENFYEVDWNLVESATELTAVRTQSQRTWLLYTFVPVLESVHPDIMEAIEADFELIEVFPGTVREGEIFVSVANSDPSS